MKVLLFCPYTFPLLLEASYFLPPQWRGLHQPTYADGYHPLWLSDVCAFHLYTNGYCSHTKTVLAHSGTETAYKDSPMRLLIRVCRHIHKQMHLYTKSNSPCERGVWLHESLKRYTHTCILQGFFKKQQQHVHGYPFSTYISSCTGWPFQLSLLEQPFPSFLNTSSTFEVISIRPPFP